MRGIVFDTMEETIESIKKDCQPFLSSDVFKRFYLDNEFLYRGEGRTFGEYLKADVNKNRTPKDMQEDIHNVLDEWFENKFGHYYRSESIFTTFNLDRARSYSHVLPSHGILKYAYIIFPCGNFDYCYSTEVEDLYDVFNETGQTSTDLFFTMSRIIQDSGLFKEILDDDGEIIPNEYENALQGPEYRKLVRLIMDGFKYYQNDSRHLGSDLGNTEIMIDCDKYIAIRQDQIEDIMKGLKN